MIDLATHLHKLKWDIPVKEHIPILDRDYPNSQTLFMKGGGDMGLFTIYSTNSSEAYIEYRIFRWALGHRINNRKITYRYPDIDSVEKISNYTKYKKMRLYIWQKLVGDEEF